MKEVERKFVLDAPPPGLEQYPSKALAQGYLAIDPAGSEVRVRRKDDETLMTVKIGIGLVRGEEEFAIERDRFERLWALTEGRRIEKVRHLISHGGRTIELDVFGGANEGLAIAEVEFPSEDAARAWDGPD